MEKLIRPTREGSLDTLCLPLVSKKILCFCASFRPLPPRESFNSFHLITGSGCNNNNNNVDNDNKNTDDSNNKDNNIFFLLQL